MSGNPIKFVKVMNTKSGIPQIVPMSTWERLSAEPKALKNLEFMFNCTEDGTRIEGGEPPKIEVKNNLTPTNPIEEGLKLQIDKLNDQLSLKDKALTESNTNVASLTTSLAEKDKELEEVKSDNKILSEENSTLSQYADSAKLEIEGLKKEIDKLKKKKKTDDTVTP